MEGEKSIVKESQNAIKELRKIQEKIKKKNKPEFIHYHHYRYWKFERRDSWRKPKGRDNKVRLEIKGYPPKVKSGYGTPEDIRGLHPSGLEPVVVSNVKELENLDPSRHIVYIASTVGLRKRAELLEAIKSRGFRVANG
ncbi:MAG: 50S ribosomal protein L32e [Acidilobaceae archaeon]